MIVLSWLSIIIDLTMASPYNYRLFENWWLFSHLWLICGCEWIIVVWMRGWFELEWFGTEISGLIYLIGILGGIKRLKHMGWLGFYKTYRLNKIAMRARKNRRRIRFNGYRYSMVWISCAYLHFWIINFPILI